MTNGKMISVEIPYEETKGGSVESGTDCYWAVKPPQDKFQFTTEEGTTHESDFLSNGWWIMGSPDVQVFNKETLKGIRELLDRIEETFDE